MKRAIRVVRDEDPRNSPELSAAIDAHYCAIVELLPAGMFVRMQIVPFAELPPEVAAEVLVQMATQ